jgi:tetratricopeptide (TPR) repeat protein
MILCQDKKYDEALAHFEKVLELDPSQHMALAEIGWIYAQKQDYDKAINSLSKAIEATLDDCVADYYYKLGRVYWMMEGETGIDTS